MRDRSSEFGDASIVVVLFTRQRNLRGYRARFVSPLTVVTDEDRDVYRLFGLGRADEETAQHGGDVVIGPDGRLAYLRPSTGADDRPSVDELLAAVQRASG